MCAEAMERVAFAFELAWRLPGLALAGEPVHRPQLAGFIGPEPLPIRFAPAG